MENRIWYDLILISPSYYESVVEVVDPICLGARIAERGCQCNCCCSVETLPEHVHNQVTGQITDEGEKDLLVTIGVFAIIKLERPTQIVVPFSDFCIPEKECTPIGEENPCKLFKKMKFPLNEFFPQPLKNFGFAEDVCDVDEHAGKPGFKR